MFDFHQICRMIRRSCEQKKLKMVIIFLVVICFIFMTVECWLNFQVRSYLRQSLGWGTGPQVKVTAHLNWLSLMDVMNGRVGWVRIDGQNCLISNMRFAKLHLENQGFTYNLGALFKERRLELLHLNKTSINTIVNASAFSDYLNLFYPQFKPAVKISPRELVLSGQMRIADKVVPVELAGIIKIVAFHSLCFYSTRLFISGHTVPQKFLNFISAQLPLQFTVMEEWPLALSAVTLRDGYVIMTFKEMNRLTKD